MERWPGVPAYLGGSPLAGLGTPSSDVDLFVVSGHPGHTEQIFVDETRVDVESVSAAALEDLVARCEHFTVTESDMTQLRFAQTSVLDRLVRFSLGEIVSDDGTLAGLLDRARRAEGDIAKLVIARQASSTGNLAEDAYGALAVGDHASAQYLGRQALLASAEAFLTARGDAYFGSKWVWARWERSVGDQLGEPVRQVLYDPAAPVDRSFWLAQDLLVHAMTGRAYPIIVDPAPRQPRRDPSVVPALTTGPVLLNRQDSRAVRVSPQGALLWGVAHGRPRAEAVSFVAGLLGVAEATVDAYYTGLLDSGVLIGEGANRAGH
ncbi:hypothetical protein [Kitasatospora sp. HPMI-4]|uniref:hypothetical protein n=1 Tax=Kitasatospora sp. HPMI-4 TaxID=3448443 RepID=UPI003F1A0D7C